MTGAPRRLLLVRHAKAVPAAAGLSEEADHERPLLARGRDEAAQLDAWLVQRRLLPDHVIVSSSRRTRETRDGLVASAAGASTDIERTLFLAEADRLLASVQEASVTAGKPVGTLMLIAHNPGIHELAMRLAGAALEGPFKPCTAAILRVDGEWHDLSPSSVTLDDVFRP